MTAVHDLFGDFPALMEGSEDKAEEGEEAVQTGMAAYPISERQRLRQPRTERPQAPGLHLENSSEDQKGFEEMATGRFQKRERCSGKFGKSAGGQCQVFR